MTVVHVMLSNAVIAAVLALVALAIGSAFRSPRVRHALWLIVLLKLVTPPVLSIPITVPATSWMAPAAELPNNHTILLSASAADTSRSLNYTVARPPSMWDWLWPLRVIDFAIVIWVLGAIAWFGWQGRRIIRFRRRVANAELAPEEVVAAAGNIAKTLGIVHPPQVKVATGIGSPMLWGRGRNAVILFPRELLARLSPEARDTLLAHELAHFLRGDHLVRVLEYFATGLFWWHPAVWLARRGIEAAEEECCDAWVVAGLAASARRYAEALLETVNFEAELRRPRLPPGACAANRSARLLHHRLTQIIHARPPRRVRGGTLFWLFVAVALVTRPVLRAASPEIPEPATVSSITAKEKTKTRSWNKPTPRLQPTKNEPREWATASDGRLTVLARANEFVLHRSDGTDRTLGPERPLAMAFAPGGQRLATVGPKGKVRTWDDHGNILGETEVPAAARAIVYHPDGAQLFVLDAARNITVLDSQSLAFLTSWSVARRKTFTGFDVAEEPANSITCSPDGQSLAVSFGDWLGNTGTVELWSISERRKIATYPVSAPVGATRFSPDGRVLVIGCFNGLVTWISLPNGELMAKRELSKDVVSNTAFCPNAGTLPLEPPPEPPAPVLPDLVQKGSDLTDH